MTREYWLVGDTIKGAGTPTPGKPYIIPTANQHDQMCDMEITITHYDGNGHYEGVVASITPIGAERTAHALRSIHH